MPIYASHIVAGARHFLGVPWRHRGRSPQRLDCLGLLLLAALGAGWVPKHPEAVARLDYDRHSSTDELIEVLDGEGERIDVSEKNTLGRSLLPGDVLVFRFSSGPWAQHVGLVTEVNGDTVQMIHSRSTGVRSTSKVVEHSLADGWLEALDAAYRLEGVVQDG